MPVFSHKILNESEHQVTISESTNIWYFNSSQINQLPSPAEAFAYSISSALEFINISLDTPEELSPNYGIKFFLQFLKKHPYFSTNTVINNTLLCEKLEKIAEKDSRDRSVIGDFIKIIPQFVVPGISQASIISENLAMQDRFDDVNFPVDMIPPTYRCTISGQVMSSPYNLEGNFIDTSVLRKLRKDGKKSPFTRNDLPNGLIEPDSEIRQKINLLIQKVDWLYETFQENSKYNQKYQEYKWLFDDSLSFESFSETVLVRESQQEQETQSLANFSILTTTAVPNSDNDTISTVAHPSSVRK